MDFFTPQSTGGGAKNATPGQEVGLLNPTRDDCHLLFVSLHVKLPDIILGTSP